MVNNVSRALIYIKAFWLMARKIKKSERQKAIEKADKYCSLFVRLSHTDKDWNCTCYTCYKKKHRKEIQCWHNIWRSYISVRYNLDNVRPQCWWCNSKMMWNWRPVEFKAHLIDEIWEERVKAVEEKALAEVKDPIHNNLSTPEILEIAEDFKEKLKPYKHLIT